MVNIYRGNIRKRVGKIYPENNLFGMMNTYLYKQDAFLVEVVENKFMDIDELFSGKINVLNLYTFKENELFVDPRSLVLVRAKTQGKSYKK